MDEISESSSGQTPNSVWYSRNSSFRSGTSRPPRFLFLPSFQWLQARRRFSHSFGSSERTLIRARTSSLRFVSWVDVAFREWGHRARVSPVRRWNVFTDTTGDAGFPPTSFRETRRLFR